MKRWKIAAAAALTVSVSAFAAPPTIPLDCGKVASIKSEAERQYLDKASGGGDIYNVNLTYIGQKPSNKQVDSALRNCLAVAVKMDGSKDILATAWYRSKAGNRPNDDDMLNPYGGMKYISYTASKKSIAVHELKLK